MKNILITWHYTTHGIAYLKHILSVFHQKGNHTFKDEIHWSNLSQNKLNDYFDSPRKKGFTFDKVFYLTAPENTFEKISNRKKYRTNMLDDPIIKDSSTIDIWKLLLEKEDIKSPTYLPSLAKDLEYVKVNFEEKYPLFFKQIWRDIQHYTVNDQVQWFLNHSNAKTIYSDKFEVCKTDLINLRNTKVIVNTVQVELGKIVQRFPNANYYINISLGSSETQVAWHVLSQAGRLPTQTKFLKTYDAKEDKINPRFKNFRIREVPVQLFESIKPIPIFKNTQSEKRKIANLKMKYYIRAGFSILLLGERGTGKSALTQVYKDKTQNFISVNCASFDEDSKAESELFGYVKGAFTGANSDKKGLFQEAANGILFLDEVHHLSKRVQGKLMKALQTDEFNNFNIRQMGSTKEKKVKCTVIFATNQSIEALKEKYLYEDFFDRIAQNVIELPSLRETAQDRQKDWETVVKNMKFKPTLKPVNTHFIQWLEQLPLYGNFRDLQKIAIYCHNYQCFQPELKTLLKQEGITDANTYVKQEFEKLQSKSNESISKYFDIEKSIQEIEKDFQKDLANWLNKQFGSMEKASQYFKDKFGKTVTQRTLQKWKNGK